MGTVLIVGGESPVGPLVHLALRERGHKVENVGTAEAALAALEEQTFELLVLDLTGLTLGEEGILQRIRAIQHRATTPIFVLSRAYDVQVTLTEAQLGVVEHLTEPLDRVAIGTAIDRLFSASAEELELRRGTLERRAKVFRDVIDLQGEAARKD